MNPKKLKRKLSMGLSKIIIKYGCLFDDTKMLMFRCRLETYSSNTDLLTEEAVDNILNDLNNFMKGVN